eukprot:PhF_6_TR26937/c0_g1_i2/m.39276/K20165/TBC1D2; TBC1 domain family member 2A
MLTVAIIAGASKLIQMAVTQSGSVSTGNYLEDLIEDDYGFTVPRPHRAMLMDYLKSEAGGYLCTAHHDAVRRCGTMEVQGYHTPTCLFRFGCPPELRRELWLKTSGADKICESLGGVEYYDSCAAKANESIIAEVQKDLHRTLPRCERLNTYEYIGALKKLLCAISSHSVTSYCQGMNVLAAFLLLVYGYDRDVDAFYTLVAIMENPRYNKDYYDKTISGARRDCAVIDILLERDAPEVREHVANLLGVSLADIFLDWLMCGFVDVVPSEWAVRVWDLYLAQGACVMVSVCLALISYHESILMESSESTTTNAVKSLRDQLKVCVKLDEILIPVFRDKARYVTPSQLDELRQQALIRMNNKEK